MDPILGLNNLQCDSVCFLIVKYIEEVHRAGYVGRGTELPSSVREHPFLEPVHQEAC